MQVVVSQVRDMRDDVVLFQVTENLPAIKIREILIRSGGDPEEDNRIVVKRRQLIRLNFWVTGVCCTVTYR